MAKRGDNQSFSMQEVDEAEETLTRFSSYLKVAFPELLESQGFIESTIQDIPLIKKALERKFDVSIPGQFILKCDHALPISGSIKARGGIFEVLRHAERLAIAGGKLKKRITMRCWERRTSKHFSSSTQLQLALLVI